ncbi:Uncharacterized protein T09_7692 [Trichinella sp. T9]|nr:Uncharacterized protein T09_10374 [Trichinella sp. T9]KRX51745.1 Uncharacterized protein T09_5146 [Trichinella sp. T9]KRX62634.1 Uncharacterized protein T09_7692 [Trichinella sp. T9]
MSSRKIRVTVVIENFPCKIEIDTGSEYTILSECVFRKLSQERKIRLEPITLKLATFQGELVKVKGSCSVNVQYGNIHRTLTLIVAKGHCPNLLGLNWFEPLGIHLSGVHHLMSTPPQISEVLRKYKFVFTEELGMYVGKPVSLDLDPNVTPICMKARKIPFALREKTDAELDRLVEQGVLEPVDHLVWSTPIGKHAYPIPAVNQLLASLSGGKVFAKLDLAQAYQQLTVDDATADAQTIITHRGTFRVKRLQFGISAAPGIFQNVIDKTVTGIQGVLPYFDDILIAASDEKELANRLETVLHRFAKAGLRIKSDKCKFCLPRVEFLGFEIDATGIHPAKAKVQAIQDVPTPKNKQQLQAFLGLLNFYHSFLKDKATVAEPLHRLLDKKARWTWTSKHGKAFGDTCDASPHGIGAVLCHKLSSTQEIPIAFYSRTLSATERNYAEIDKESLAVIAGNVTLSILLNAYDYTINYRPGKEIANADALSRLLKQSTENNDSHNPVILLLETIDNFPLHGKDIARITAKDPILTRVLSWAWRGWPKSVSDERLKPYVTRQHEISIHNGCLLWDSRVIIPLQARHKILKELHISHPGIVRMKVLARSYVWWPKLDSEIENLVRTCELCQQPRASPPHAPVHKLLKNTTSESVISCLRQIFSINGLPDIIVSDKDVVPEDLDRNFENLRTFQTDDQVYAKNYSSGKTWKPVTDVTRQAHCPTREETVEAIPEEDTAVVTTPREESAVVSPSPDTNSVGQQRSSTQKRRPPQCHKGDEC